MFGNKYIVTVIQAKLIFTWKVLHFENEGIFWIPEMARLLKTVQCSIPIVMFACSDLPSDVTYYSVDLYNRNKRSKDVLIGKSDKNIPS